VRITVITLRDYSAFFLAIAYLLGLGALPRSAHGQLRIVTYNSSGVHSPQLLTVLQAIGNESVNGVAKKIDVLALQEQDFVGSNTQTIVGLLNGFYGAGTYARSVTNGDTTGGGRQTLIYNTQTIERIAEIQVGTLADGIDRPPIRFQLRLKDYDSSSDFYLYNHHYKASDGTTERTARNDEAQIVRANADALGPNQRIIYAGDFNIYRSSEPMWATLTEVGDGKAYDPIDRVGTWHDAEGFKDVHTQSPTTTQRYGGQTTGGMDDRFDWQMITDSLRHSEGMAYLPNSYHAFGNSGTHALNGNIDAGAPPDSILVSIANASDHLPVVAQYQVPAKMGVQIAAVSSQVVMGASLSAQITVSNTAGSNSAMVATATGADELDYGVVASGTASGSVNGTDQALGSGNVHGFSLSTATVGAMTATFTTTATSPQVPDSVQMNQVNYNVLDHANASFTALVDQNSLTIDFGSATVGSGTLQQAFSLQNLVATAGFTAPLDLLSIIPSGDSSVLTTSAISIDNLAAGSSAGFFANFATGSLGTFSATYMLSFSDDTALLGAIGGQTLTLNLLGQVVGSPGVPGDFDSDGDVDGADFVIWQTNFPLPSGGTLAMGDSNADGDVDGGDFAVWQTHFPTSPGPALVPEPEAWLLALIASVAALRVRRISRR
jgi:hypothetical protein